MNVIIGWVAAVLLAALAGYNVHEGVQLLSTNVEAALGCFFGSLFLCGVSLLVLRFIPPRPQHQPEDRGAQGITTERTTCP